MCGDESVYEYQATDRSLKHLVRGSIKATSELDARTKLDSLGMSSIWYLWPKGEPSRFIRQQQRNTFTTRPRWFVGALVPALAAPGTLILTRTRVRRWLLTAALFAAAIAVWTPAHLGGEKSLLGVSLFIVGGFMLLGCFYTERIVCKKNPRQITFMRRLWRRRARTIDCDQLDCLRIARKTYITLECPEVAWVSSLVLRDGFEYPIARSHSARAAEREVAKVLSEFWDVPYTIVSRDDAE